MTVCSGIGAPENAASWIDWRYQSEIEKFPSAVLKARYPNSINLGDMTKYKDWPDATVDVLCGGTPCQAFSVAGLRKGLADPRGNLMLTYLAIAACYQPKWLVWENVPGVLSSNGGRDFAALIGGLERIGYHAAWRVLDVQYGRTLRFPFAIPQRRRRVFLVGYLGDWRRAAAVFFDGESLSGNPAPRRKAGQKPAPTLSARTKGGGGLGTDFDLDGGLVANSGQVSHTLCASAQGSLDAETETILATVSGQGSSHSLTAEGHDASEDGSGRGTPIIAFGSKDHGADAMEEVCPTLRAGGHDGSHPNAGVPPAIAFNSREDPEVTGDRTGPLGASTPQAQAVAFDLNQITSKTNRSQPDPAIHHTLPATAMPPHLALPWAVRRLTPSECERLMGFPDGWTKIEWRGKTADACPDGPRYKALGNSWGINAGEYVFDRIRIVEGI